ncbi:uncharacterized protein LOC111796566 [Cucurbita pepo subsp. pepo]|uniref:uncharacterized protein LOC111796566 n=1 Tax=Cucurbita pepo subsp. pepo TaxID=3664 RepID=UPI000C9D4B6F|nr:uncharacterized protein LOC111796566 [Cucurbita pepo subsp. pepo]XP_023535021.1 uncharacterized protein LOC111796566 [Cucurbita pepo subsp. pepo]XP_023535029.1 uncharacterized protein LOC111796566 [Cucurbita pepo subsp. pepo]
MAASTSIFSPTAATAAAVISSSSSSSSTHRPLLYNFPSKITTQFNRPTTRILVSSSSSSSSTSTSRAAAAASKNAAEEIVFFDGGAHYGDLVANLLLGFTLLWLPLTVAAVSRAFNLRYRFTNLRVTVISGLTGEDRSDFSYQVIKDVQVVPRFIGEWGDVVITLKDGTKVDLRSVPKFREIAKYCLSMADKPAVPKESGPKGF